MLYELKLILKVKIIMLYAKLVQFIYGMYLVVIILILVRSLYSIIPATVFAEGFDIGAQHQIAGLILIENGQPYEEVKECFSIGGKEQNVWRLYTPEEQYAIWKKYNDKSYIPLELPTANEAITQNSTEEIPTTSITQGNININQQFVDSLNVCSTKKEILAQLKKVILIDTTIPLFIGEAPTEFLIQTFDAILPNVKNNNYNDNIFNINGEFSITVMEPLLKLACDKQNIVLTHFICYFNIKCYMIECILNQVEFNLEQSNTIYANVYQYIKSFKK
jgi:hypothetical protein